MAHVAPYKKQLVETLATRCAQARVVGIANIHGIPAPQFQDIRKKLSGRATITVAKNNLLRLALQQASVQLRPKGFGAKPESTVMMYAESFMGVGIPSDLSRLTLRILCGVLRLQGLNAQPVSWWRFGATRPWG